MSRSVVVTLRANVDGFIAGMTKAQANTRPHQALAAKAFQPCK